MKNEKMSKGVTACYTSLEELRAAWGLKPVTRRTKDENKLNTQRIKFQKNHLCKSCGKPMTFIGGNQMVCSNSDCLGIEIEHTDKEGNITMTYLPSYDLLDNKGTVIAQNIFDW